jgi:hypothetical protein
MNRAQLLAGVSAFDELKRRGQEDPLASLQLHHPQTEFCASEAPIAAYCGANRCLAAGQRVLMADLTWKPVEAVRVGDRVACVPLAPATKKGQAELFRFGRQSFATVVRAGPTGQKRCVRLRYRTGSLVCSTDHPMLTISSDRKRGRWCPAGEVRHGTKLVRPERIAPEHELPAIPERRARLLGYLLGDGSLVGDSIRFTNRNPTIVADLQDCVPAGYHVRRNGQTDDYFISVPGGVKGGNGLIKDLRAWGLWGCRAHEKFIPPVLLRSSDEVLRGLVAGLFATDGCIQDTHADYFSTSRQLIDDLHVALWRLGICGMVTTRRRMAPQHRQSWRLRVTFPDMGKLPPIPGKPWHGLVRQRIRQRDRTGVLAVTDAGTHTVYDLTIDDPGHAFIAEGVVVHNSGKSVSLARITASYARTGNLNPKPASGGPGIWVYDRAVSIWVIGQTFPLLRETFIPLVLDNGFVSPTQRVRPLIPESELLFFKQSESIAKLKNGSIITFRSGEAPAKVYAAAARDLVCFDEPPRKDVWSECAIRIGAGGSKLKLRLAATLLPEAADTRASWFFTEIVEPWQQGHRPDVEIFSGSIYDNPHLDPDEVDRMIREFPPGTPEHDIRILGKLIPGVSGTRAYPRFQRGIHAVDELGPWSQDHDRPLCLSLDFNVDPMVMTISQLHGRGDETTIDVLDEVYLRPGTIDRMADEFRRRYPHHGAELRIYGDASGNHRDRQTGITDIAAFLAGLEHYRSPIRVCIPDKNPPVQDRLNATNRMLRDGHGRVRIRISATHCPELVKDLEHVLRDPRTIIKKSSKPTDPYRLRTHCSDTLDYLCAFEAPLPAYAALGRHRAIRRIPSPQYHLGGQGAPVRQPLLLPWRGAH